MAAPLSEGAVQGLAPVFPVDVGTGRVGRWVRELDVVIPAFVLALFVFFCFIWPLVYHVPNPVKGNPIEAFLGVGARGHLLGTDGTGYDELSRLLYGGRVSFEVAAGTQAIGLLLGGFLGVLSAYRGGLTEAVIMRVLDVFIAFPSLVLVLAIADCLGPSELHVIWAISVFSIPAFGRLSRAATLKLREEAFMSAAQLAGTRGRRMLLGHIAPNILPQLFTFALLGMGIAMILEGALSYIGAGIPAPWPSWGNMIAEGQTYLSVYPRLVLLPSLCLLVAVLAVNTLGDGLRARWGLR